MPAPPEPEQQQMDVDRGPSGATATGAQAGTGAKLRPAATVELEEHADGSATVSFTDEAAAFLMSANSALDASAAKRSAEEWLGSLQEAKKLRVVQPGR